MTARGFLAAAVVAVLTAALAWGASQFARQPGLGTFADDSVSYLVLAQGIAGTASEAVREAIPREAFYPPLYPAFLALAGGANDFARAHVATALLLAACLPLVYLLGLRWLGQRAGALAATLVVAVLPATWLASRSIMSEPLYLLVFLLLLLALEWQRRPRWMEALLLCALVLTRSAGLAIAAAQGAWAASRPGLAWRSRFLAAMPCAAAFAAYVAWRLIRPESTEDDYARILAERVSDFLAPASLLRQAHALWEAWAGALLLFWVEGQPARLALAGLAGLLALAGLAIRLAQGRPDAWLMLAYLGTYLVWPFYDQVGRLLYPAIPVLVLYAFLAAGRVPELARRPAMLGQAVLAVLVLSLALPAAGFIRQRAGHGGPEAAILDWYRTPDLSRAQARARIHLALEADMAEIRKLTPPGARVMWVGPSYVALLADRPGVRSPEGVSPQEYRRRVEASGAQYVFLSEYHPRDTIRDTAWRVGRAALQGAGEVVHQREGAMLVRLPR